jgi:hypothetical protein
MVLAGLSFVLISLFQASGGRQLFGSMIVAVILAASIVPLSFQKVALALVTVTLSIQGYSAWTQNDEHYAADVRVSTAEWFIQNAEDGSRIAMESVPLELMRLHGYEDEKQFEAVTTRSIYTFPPELWQCMAFDYLVADAGYASYGGYYSGDGLPPNYRDHFELVAQFHQPDFVGGQRTIFRIMPADLTCDSEAVEAALTELQVEPGPTVYHAVGYFPAFAENDILQGLQQGYGAFAARIVGEDQQPIAGLTLEIRSDAGHFVGETFPIENESLHFLQENVTIGNVPEGIYTLIVRQGTTNIHQQIITIESRKTAFFHIQLRSLD